MPSNNDGWEDIPWEEMPRGQPGGPTRFDPSRMPPAPEERSFASRALGEAGNLVGGFLGGAAQELPLVGARLGNLGEDVAHGAALLGADALGIDENESPALRSIGNVRQQRRQALEQSSLQADPNASPEEQVGRTVARIAPQIALGAATGGTSLPVQMGAAALGQGAQALSEGASPGEAAVSGGMAAAGPAAGRALGAGGRWLRRGAVQQYTRALNPTQRAGKLAAPRIVPELLDRGVTGNLDELAQMGAQRSEEVGEQIAGRYAGGTARGQRIDADALADELERLREPFIGRARDQAAAVEAATSRGPHGPIVDPVKMELANRGLVVLDDSPFQAISDIQSRLRSIQPDPENLWKLRRNLDNIVNASNGFTRPISPRVAASVARDARSVLQRGLTQADPDIRALNEEYRLWEDLQTIARETALRKTGQQGSAGWVARGAGGLAGSAVGAAGGPLGAAGGALAGAQVSKTLTDLMSSPAWRTVSAVQKAKLSRLMTSQTPQRAIDYMLRLGAQQIPSGPRDYAADVDRARREQNIRRQNLGAR